MRGSHRSVFGIGSRCRTPTWVRPRHPIDVVRARPPGGGAHGWGARGAFNTCETFPTPTGNVAPPPGDQAAGDDEKVRRSYGYRDLNTFVVTLRRDDRPTEQVELLMDRRGLFNWKLAGIDLTPVDPEA